MKPWTVDADDIKIAEDFDDGLLHKPPWLEAFLNAGDDKFIVVGTKGFGKTLLLKAKRIRLQRADGVLCIPENTLLDKPIGDKIFGKDQLALYAESTEWWTKVWLIAIAAAVLKRLDLLAGVRVDARLAALLEDRSLRGVIDHFVNLLDLPRSELHRCATDVDNALVPRLRALNSPVAIFIDNVDEYFNKHVRAVGRASHTGEVSPSIWYFAQMGLVEVAYQLRRVNHHLKVFAAVRKEAFLRFDEMTSMVQQYRGSAVDMHYTVESLREIFVNNIRREKDRNLALPELARSRPIEAFLGQASVVNAFTHEAEDAFEYIARHTLHRPRDFMTVGQKLSDLTPAERRVPERFKEVVNQAANEIAAEYLNEIAPYLGTVDLPRVLGALSSNVLRRQEVEDIFFAHNADAGPTDELEHIFCMLYRAGLLGHLELDHVSGKRVQRFLRPGEQIFQPDGLLPDSTHYLVHPVLSGLIARLNPRYVAQHDRVNLVGNGRPWKDATDRQLKSLMVLRADLDGFGALMQRGLDDAVRDVLRSAVERHTGDCLHASLGDGDSLLLVDDRILTLIKAARRIMEEVSEVPGSPRMRVAIAAGPVAVRERGEDPPAIEGGSAVLVAARIEPLVRPGEIWVTDEVGAALAAADTIYRAEPLPPMPHLRGRQDGAVNVRKPDSDEHDIWVRLQRVVS
jgi:class 3 adenylate cyclase